MSAGALPRKIAVALLGAIVVLGAAALLFDPNWLRGPIERRTLAATGRELSIDGDLSVDWGWPVTKLAAAGVRFANPGWAEAPQMLTAENIAVGVHLPALVRRHVVLPEIRLDEMEVALEQHPDGRRNWLLDREQKDENARVEIGRLSLRDGRILYVEPARDTRIDAKVSTDIASATERPATATAGETAGGVRFEAAGRYLGQPLRAKGSGGPVLALRDESTPYPLDVQAEIGSTRVKAEGSVTSLLKFSAVELDIDLRGPSLDALYPLIGIALPKTPPYRTAGHLVRERDEWRYEKFSGAIGRSEVAGTLRVTTGRPRPRLDGALSFRTLDFADLGPLVGSDPPARGEQAAAAPRARVLPTTPFRTERWHSVDADVKLEAGTIRRPDALPIDKLSTRLQMDDAVLTLDPLEFGIAGGRLTGTIRLDGRSKPLAAATKLRARNLHLAELFPTFELARSSIGEVNGSVELKGRGDSIAAMLGSADGEVALVLGSGQISRFMMEAIGLHLWEMLQLKLGGDELVDIRCVIADFAVEDGVMNAQALVLDTEVTRVTGEGRIDLGHERLDLTLHPDTKVTSPIALRSPIYVRGSFAKPEPSIDTGRVAARGLGAVALGLVNPVLALIPLVETGPGKDSDCARLIREAKDAGTR